MDNSRETHHHPSKKSKKKGGKTEPHKEKLRSHPTMLKIKAENFNPDDYSDKES